MNGLLSKVVLGLLMTMVVGLVGNGFLIWRDQAVQGNEIDNIKEHIIEIKKDIDNIERTLNSGNMYYRRPSGPIGKDMGGFDLEPQRIPSP